MPDYIPNGIIVADIVRLRLSNNLISKKFLVHEINSQHVIKQFEDHVKGTTRPRVNLTMIRDFQIKLPPLNEQKRIVSKIESIFAEIDSMDKYIKTSIQQLDMLKSSVLKQAFEGKLVSHNPKDEPVAQLLAHVRGDQ